jgi:OmpA-OmpF porin, OOP family
MHQPIKWWTGLIPLALVWIIGNFVRTDAIETDLASRTKAAVTNVSGDLRDKPSIVVAGRDVTISGMGLTPQGVTEIDSATNSTFGVRKVIDMMSISQAVRPAAVSPPPPSSPMPPKALGVADCQAALTATFRKGKIQFESASAQLANSTLPLLADVISIAKQCPTGTIEVAGHTDSSGEPDRNLVLSKARAQSVVDYLVKNAIDPARISAVGYGDTRPVAPNNTEDGKAQNRRIEFTVK